MDMIFFISESLVSYDLKITTKIEIFDPLNKLIKKIKV